MTSYLMITGATGGLGSALSIECARRSFPLFLTDLRPNGAEFAHFLSEKFGVEVRYAPCDLTSPTARSEFFNALISEKVRFWGLINVAGTDYEGPFLEKSRDQIMTVLELNIKSTVDMTHAILKLRDTEKRFMLVNICSLAAFAPMPYKATYAATKRFLLDFSLAIRDEIQDFGTVTAVCPAGLPTTPETMRAIFAQGFWGQMTTVSTQSVARQTIGRALRGQPVFVPGVINFLLRQVEGITPTALAIKIVSNRWRKSQEERLAWNPVDKALTKIPGTN